MLLLCLLPNTFHLFYFWHATQNAIPEDIVKGTVKKKQSTTVFLLTKQSDSRAMYNVFLLTRFSVFSSVTFNFSPGTPCLLFLYVMRQEDGEIAAAKVLLGVKARTCAS